MSVEERRNPKPSTSTTPEAQQTNEQAAKQSTTKTDRTKKSKRRMEDEDGFIIPAKHLISRGGSKGPKSASKNNATYGKPIPAPQPRTQPPVSNRRFADVAAGRAQNLIPPTEAPLNKSAMEFFKLLLAYIDDESIDFDQLLEAVRLALPSLNSITDHHEKAVTLLRFYNIVRKIIIFNMLPFNNINLHSLRIGYWNANGVRRQLQEVKEFVSDHDLIFFLSKKPSFIQGLTRRFQISHSTETIG
ncbi:hypothetical protein CEXT_243401 [Caerostris extrusa]|uniref:Uncharacterized protein n=1 Tax=Caerostris extrusa TaxID=172846 RepID=A0AAV4TS30_CAEEX|nr:hypothetical protein CEXT_243401 [Caerostris extrusa]